MFACFVVVVLVVVVVVSILEHISFFPIVVFIYIFEKHSTCVHTHTHARAHTNIHTHTYTELLTYKLLHNHIEQAKRNEMFASILHHFWRSCWFLISFFFLLIFLFLLLLLNDVFALCKN